MKSKLSRESKKESAPLGRKRDQTLDDKIIEAAASILAEVGFDNMTMDMVAAAAKSGKATVYRRWKSKEELVKDTLIWMSRNSVELDNLPDTRTLRGDLLAVLKPYSIKYSELKLRVLSGLGSFFSKHQKLAEETTNGIFEPMTDVNRRIMERAIERGEISSEADIETACEVIIAMISFYSLGQKKQFDTVVYANLLDNILIPALKNSPTVI